VLPGACGEIAHVARTCSRGARRLAGFDPGIAIASVPHATDHDATGPLHVDVLADTVVTARRRMAQPRGTLPTRDRSHPAPPVRPEITALSPRLADIQSATRRSPGRVALWLCARRPRRRVRGRGRRRR